MQTQGIDTQTKLAGHCDSGDGDDNGCPWQTHPSTNLPVAILLGIYWFTEITDSPLGLQTSTPSL